MAVLHHPVNVVENRTVETAHQFLKRGLVSKAVLKHEVLVAPLAVGERLGRRPKPGRFAPQGAQRYYFTCHN